MEISPPCENAAVLATITEEDGDKLAEIPDRIHDIPQKEEEFWL